MNWVGSLFQCLISLLQWHLFLFKDRLGLLNPFFELPLLIHAPLRFVLVVISPSFDDRLVVGSLVLDFLGTFLHSNWLVKKTFYSVVELLVLYFGLNIFLFNIQKTSSAKWLVLHLKIKLISLAISFIKLSSVF